jgi:hypothetical protein
VTDYVVANVLLVPDSLLVIVGDRFKITARPRNAAGQTLTKLSAGPSAIQLLQSAGFSEADNEIQLTPCWLDYHQGCF